MVVVGPISHRGAAMLHRAIAPIVVFFAILVGGLWATLSQVVWSSESESTLQGGHFNVSHSAHPHHWMVVYDECASGVIMDTGVGGGNTCFELPIPFNLNSNTSSMSSVTFELVTHDIQLDWGNDCFSATAYSNVFEGNLSQSLGYTVSLYVWAPVDALWAISLGTTLTPDFKLDFGTCTSWGCIAARFFRIKRNRWTLLYDFLRPWRLGFGFLVASLSILFCARFSHSSQDKCVMRLQHNYGAARHAMLLIFMLMHVEGANSVTCSTCCDQISGCTGGSDCPLLKSTAANVAAITASGAAVLTVAQLLPFSYVRHLTSDVLRALQAIARAPSGAAPVDLTSLDEAGLVDAYQQGRADLDAIRGEIGNRVADASTSAARVARLQAISSVFKDAPLTSTGREIEGCHTVGGLSFCLAVASHIVKSEKSTYSVGDTSQASSSSDGKRRGGVTSRLSIKTPTSFALFAELLHVWQAILHALGLSNALITTQFLQEVVFDAMSQLSFTWQQAYCLLLIYIEAVESHPTQYNLANVFGAGSQDTRCKAAKERSARLFKVKPDDERPQLGIKWNGKDTPDSKAVCYTYNLGPKATHPAKSLLSDGTCKFRHVCNQFVTGKGKGGICEGNHARAHCENPGKCDKPADA